MRVSDWPEPVIEVGGEEMRDRLFPLHCPAARRKPAGQGIEVAAQRFRLEGRCGIIQHAHQAALARHGVRHQRPHGFGQHRPAGRAARRRGGLCLIEKVDQRATAPACIVQPTTVPHADRRDGEPPAPPEIRLGICGQAARTVLQLRARPPGACLRTQQEPAVLEQCLRDHIAAGQRGAHR